MGPGTTENLDKPAKTEIACKNFEKRREFVYIFFPPGSNPQYGLEKYFNIFLNRDS